MYVPVVCAAIRKPHHSWREKKWKKRKWNGESGVLRHKWWSEGYILSMVVIQDSRVYMLCKVAQVFMLEGLLFASTFSGEESKYITLTDKVCVPHTPVLWSVLLLVLVTLVELPHFSSLYQRCISDLLDRQWVCLQIIPMFRPQQEGWVMPYTTLVPRPFLVGIGA